MKQDTLNTNPNLMTVIINIQNLDRYIHRGMNTYSFETLRDMCSDELHKLQDTLIQKYNYEKRIKENGK